MKEIHDQLLQLNKILERCDSDAQKIERLNSMKIRHRITELNQSIDTLNRIKQKYKLYSPEEKLSNEGFSFNQDYQEISTGINSYLQRYTQRKRELSADNKAVSFFRENKPELYKIFPALEQAGYLEFKFDKYNWKLDQITFAWLIRELNPGYSKEIEEHILWRGKSFKNLHVEYDKNNIPTRYIDKLKRIIREN